MTTPSPADIAHYRETGYLELRNVVEPTAMQRLIATTERLQEAGRRLAARTRHYGLELGHSPQMSQQPRIRRIASPTELDEVYVELAF